ncbi:hemerythrin-like metal-binding protein [Magnetococcus marinus MC-1]|uniref:Hemerythrin-like metal-binding protein n=1 Tax=Magnetococcus marinus (strain ATCC BAA-1437 / JCM 17883 / MC-1) TaxID=156889 RepID=A0LCN2_MAGMM|nr:hemerythrin family protein [Magnetococcus marinus]ABK45725.1 hemerythrin-like metal-binding protein [Magnetococcus marinus MC-1]
MSQPTGLVRTGIGPIDRDHLHLWDLFQTLLEKDLREDEALAVLKELLAYTRYHFGREERLMQEIGLTGEPRQAHIHEHAIFVKRVENFLELLQNRAAPKTTGLQAMVEEIQKMHQLPTLPQLDPAKRVVAFLVDWILNHTSGMDVELANHTEAAKGPLANQDFSFLESDRPAAS